LSMTSVIFMALGHTTPSNPLEGTPMRIHHLLEAAR
jgi:hypothetical protein